MLRRTDLQFSEEVLDASSRFRQGSIIRDIPVCFTANVEHPITLAAREQVSQDNDIVRINLPFAIITSQTCDLQNRRRIAIRPFIYVARVFDASEEFDASYIGNIIRNRVGDLIRLTGPGLSNGPVWIADLRVEGGVERGALVGQHPLDGFSDDEGYFQFQRSVSAVRGRNAIDDRVIAEILLPLQSWLKANPTDSDAVEEIRIRVLPSILRANSVELYFLCYDDADPAVIQQSASAWYTTLSARLPADLRLLDVTVTPTSVFTRADEIGTERLDFDDLSEAR
jgi:hypothetical protein